jgi:nucleoid DNA-binding protein
MLTMPERYVIVFRASEALRDKINNKDDVKTE